MIVSTASVQSSSTRLSLSHPTIMLKNIIIRCFSNGAIKDVLGGVLDIIDDENITIEDDVDTVHPFVSRTLQAYRISYIPLSTIQTFTFQDGYVIRVRDSRFLRQSSSVYVCGESEKAALQKFLRRQDEKEKKISLEIESKTDNESKPGPRASMGRSTLERLQYHIAHKDDCDYTKYVFF